MVRANAKTRAIVCFVEDNKHLIQQSLALRESWLHAQSADTDIVIFGPASALAQIPDDVVRIEQRAASDEPLWSSYRYMNSIACLNGEGSHRLDGYAHLLRADVDTFITPAWNHFNPTTFVCGNGGYSNDEHVRAKIRGIADAFGLKHRGLVNTGSTWYGPASLVRRLGALTDMLTRHILCNEFRDGEGAWPGWYRGVSTLYASEIAINHLAPEAVKSNALDFYSTSTNSVHEHPHIHCWHTDEKFSKHWFMSGRYTSADCENLDLSVIRDYAMEMSFRSLRQMRRSAAAMRARTAPIEA